MDLDLHDLHALVTGASGGIGRAIVRALHDEGARVTAHAGRGGEGLRAWLATEGLDAHVVTADVTDPDALAAAFADAEARYGAVDVVVVNAGVWPPDALPLHDLPVARVRHTVDVDLLGALWTCRAWMDGLRRRGPRADGRGPSAVLIGSTAGRFGEAGHVDYAACKAALRGVTATLKNEVVHLDPWARVNLVEPGWTVTPMAEAALDEPGAIQRVLRTMPVRQLADPTDIARVVCALASPAVSRHVSGEVVTVAGGMEGRVLWPDDVGDDGIVRGRLRR